MQNIPRHRDIETWCHQRNGECRQFYFWFIALHLELLVLAYIRSLREANFPAYVDCITKLTPWFFILNHTNYARWMWIHVKIYAEALHRWMLTGPEMARLIAKFEASIGEEHTPLKQNTMNRLRHSSKMYGPSQGNGQCDQGNGQSFFWREQWCAEAARERHNGSVGGRIHWACWTACARAIWVFCHWQTVGLHKTHQRSYRKKQSLLVHSAFKQMCFQNQSTVVVIQAKLFPFL